MLPDFLSLIPLGLYLLAATALPLIDPIELSDIPSADASDTPLFPLPFTRKVNNPSNASVARFDQLRAQTLRTRDLGGQNEQGIFDISASSQVVSYVVKVEIGDPPTTYELLIDTGSSNTWVGAGKQFVPSRTTVPTLNPVSVEYGSGSFQGVEVKDRVTLAPGLTIDNQSIGVAIFSQGFDDVDGILGIGPIDLTCGTLFPCIDECIPTVTDNAWLQGLLAFYGVGISFAPAVSAPEENRELTFGGIDSTKYTGTINYVPITSHEPANKFVGVDQSVAYGDTVILEETSGIIDTGTTLILLATDAFNEYKSLTGAEMDNNVEMLKITREQYSQLKSMYFNINGIKYEFTRDAQIWPRSLNSEIGGDADVIYLVVSDNGSPSGSGIDFINGMTWLQRFYMVYDIGNSRVGIATTRHTNDTVNF
ncbi:aspartic peptidase A1 [Laetiporus sulphureus 93-53]|uniref:Aspartic peptidase A1 n=1 Tax=Laetiporus sulphureus 93-53 TaxID=1314785 RepID=A0A165DI74_9APHY|nr:aspartic peptidase A1 [Laetiporus sulphureus 93-53]KZT04938.1 aspartic peptidase A1 [Laetiporus sulphureus 93-53]